MLTRYMIRGILERVDLASGGVGNKLRYSWPRFSYGRLAMIEPNLVVFLEVISMVLDLVDLRRVRSRE